MKDLVLITCYIGKLPSYFNMFLSSCSWNKNIDFLIVTDNLIDIVHIPSNIRVVNMSFTDIQSLISCRIGDKAKLSRGYKLCDYKPTYGVLFNEYIKGYKYWGHCDIDLIWGDLECLVLPLLRKNFDRYFRYGHLTIYRNDDILLNNFKKKYSGLNYKVVFSTNINCAFDEKDGTWKLGKENGLNQYDKTVCFDIKTKKRQSVLQTYIFDNYLKQCFIVDKGHVYRYYEENRQIHKEEKAYIHFQKRSMAGIDLFIDKSYQLLFDRVIELSPEYSITDCFDRNIDKKMSLIELCESKIKRTIKSIKYNLLKLRYGVYR